MTATFMKLVDRLPLPSRRVQVITAIIVLLTQGGIAVTGSIVRVTSSGLGCPTWPECFPDSMVPVSHENVATFHQFIEFSNRMLTFLVTAAAIAIVLVVLRARRRRRVVVLAWIIPLSTVVQAVVGGITVLTGLLWWTVAIHMLLSMAMVWISVQLLEAVRTPDDAAPIVPLQARWRNLIALSALLMTAVLIAGTMVTGAGPHAGDKDADHPVKRLDIHIDTLAKVHGLLLVAYLAVLVLLAVGLWRADDGGPLVRRRLGVTIALVIAQGLVGFTQYHLDVPAALVVIHVAGAGACVAATSSLWFATGSRRLRPDAPAAQAVTAPA